MESLEPQRNSVDSAVDKFKSIWIHELFHWFIRSNSDGNSSYFHHMMKWQIWRDHFTGRFINEWRCTDIPHENWERERFEKKGSGAIQIITHCILCYMEKWKNKQLARAKYNLQCCRRRFSWLLHNLNWVIKRWLTVVKSARSARQIMARIWKLVQNSKSVSSWNIPREMKPLANEERMAYAAFRNIFQIFVRWIAAYGVIVVGGGDHHHRWWARARNGFKRMK